MMYTLNFNQTQHTSGGVFGLTVAQLQYVTVTASISASQVLIPLIIKSTSIEKGGVMATSLTGAMTVISTAAGFIIGNNLFPEAQTIATIVTSNITNTTV